jgi:hypothetical protein
MLDNQMVALGVVQNPPHQDKAGFCGVYGPEQCLRVRDAETERPDATTADQLVAIVQRPVPSALMMKRSKIRGFCKCDVNPTGLLIFFTFGPKPCFALFRYHSEFRTPLTPSVPSKRPGCWAYTPRSYCKSNPIN